ncbi:hypothetical protein LAZ67_9002640 [Cordylochernes scorpioides]|uniref:Transposase n=1 Tax=Cordylochernes scorpioides TaxID=51811 RepID=A0ABY6KUF9_9ARAC|nr:hypothetical protein LAZ67_9002640 [Cordylochernes scorpioides]
MEQRAVIKFNAKLGRSASETYILMKQIYGTLCLSKSNVFIWHKRFSDGRNTLEDDKHTGRPSSSKTPESIEKVREFVPNNRSASLRMMAEVLHINKETIRTILHEDLGKTKVCAKFVPHTLTGEQKSLRIAHCRDIISAYENYSNFLKSIVTGDETWCFQYDPKTKRQSAEWRKKYLATRWYQYRVENPRTTLLELEQDTGISKTTIGKIVTEDLKLKKTPAKCIPRFLTNEQNLCRLATCKDMFKMTRTDPEWKDKIITGDETWVYGYDPETKRQSAEWRGQGQTVIKEMYLSILRRLREAIRKKKRPEKWTNGDWILHHDNARPHTAHLVTSFLAKNGTEILPQPPYSPDIAPNDFFLFPKLKAVLKGRHFDTREDIIEKSLLALKSIPKEAYKNCFDNWEKRWRWCVEARGDYFEKF